MSGKVTVLTFATHDQGYYKCLVESCARYGYKLETLGWNQKWQGYGQKLLAVLTAMRQLPENELVMFVDAFDVLMCRSADQLESEYKSMGSPPILLGANRALPGIHTIHKLRFEDPGPGKQKCATPYSFLCSGTYLCRAGTGVRLLESLGQIGEKDDDQSQMILLRKNFGEDVVQIDCNFRIFATLTPGFLFGEIDKRDKITVEKENNTLFVKSGVTNSKPFVVHGPADTNLLPLAKNLELASSKLIQPTPTLYNVQKTIYHAFEFLKVIWIFLTLALLFIILIVFLILFLSAKINVACRNIQKNTTEIKSQN